MLAFEKEAFHADPDYELIGFECSARDHDVVADDGVVYNIAQFLAFHGGNDGFRSILVSQQFCFAGADGYGVADPDFCLEPATTRYYGYLGPQCPLDGKVQGLAIAIIVELEKIVGAH